MQLSRMVWVVSAVVLASVELSAQVKRDYYELLGVDRKATSQQIRRAFRKQAAKYHPDKNKDPGAEERFKEINEAHEVLTNADKRRQYDMFGHLDNSGSGSQGHGHTGPGGFTFHFDSNDDVLRNFFNQEFAGEKQQYHFGGQRDFHGRHPHQHHQHQQNFFSFNDFFEEEEPGFGEFFGSADPHRFGSGSSFFGSHFGGGNPEPQRGHWSHAQASGGSHCRTVTQRVGNMVTTYTQCS